jgi:transposase-like protein
VGKRRRYTDEERATAVLFLESEGYFQDKPGALTRVSERLGIPHQTLSRWAREKQNPAPPELVQEKRKALIELLRDEAYAILGDMDTTRVDADYRTLGTVLGIVVDKLQLLDGKPTERNEQTVKVTWANAAND